MEKYREFTDEELKWIRSLQRCMSKAPESLFIFAGSGTLCVYPKDENGDRYMTSIGGVDGSAPTKLIQTNCEIDGGDW